ncbi:hypothetical protein MX715_002116 [Vibrio parahaemolyticus]|uniref:hypothetical protein n=1 Tax=Vibrio parahaemolyticus TaxID=670 RepID=UPI001375D8CF|nr:hypothetical protein [Vibrio parahaemolyticus]EGR3184382.1 hypothetical protein [Vibrio parahaemolyticus]EGR3199037.1 hypothetical protein [Vibrio parahaemolyticus]EGR3260106.1 hypothetical protein [Vibrio parahaemolyticus]EJC6768603.1 hypothetical protein [Vibrio parahaemolyticus]EJC6978221.1 hypothetical protein [Vibrio parahaemolyticus]
MSAIGSSLCALLFIIYFIFNLPSNLEMAECRSKHETKYPCVDIEDINERELSYIMSSLEHSKYYLRKRSMLTHEETYYIQEKDDGGVYFGELLVDGNKITSDGKEPQLIDIGSVDKVGDVSDFSDDDNVKILVAAEMVSFLAKYRVYNDIDETYEHAIVSIYNEIGILYLDPEINIPSYDSVEDYEKSIEKQ